MSPKHLCFLAALLWNSVVVSQSTTLAHAAELSTTSNEAHSFHDPLATSLKPADIRLAGDALRRFRPPTPLFEMRVHAISNDGYQKITGGPNEDLLIVAPDRVVDGRVRIEVDGFRGVYLIGGIFDPQPHGNLIAPDDSKLEGIGALIKVRTHENAVRPFIYLSRLYFRSSQISFGDWLQVGGASDPQRPSAWPDIYRWMIRAEPLYGWRGYSGGTLSEKVSHSDFFKMEMGGVRHSYAAHIHAQFGYQHEYVAPSWRAGFEPYLHDGERSTFHYYNYLAEIVRRPDLAPDVTPKAFFLARSSKEVEQRQYNRFRFHHGGEDGLGVAIRAPGTAAQYGAQDIAEFVHPSGGSHAPHEDDVGLYWTEGSDFVKGRVFALNGRDAWPVVEDHDLDLSHRITSREALLALIANWMDGGAYRTINRPIIEKTQD